jgi:hypothetical protein
MSRETVFCPECSEEHSRTERSCPIVIQAGVARALREAWEAIEQNPSITKEGLLNILAVKLSVALNVYPEYSEREFFDAIEGVA